MEQGRFAFRALKLQARVWLDALRARKKLVALVGGGVALFFLVSLSLVPPIVRSRAEKLAVARGMTVEIQHVWPAFGGVRLEGVRVRAGQPEWLSGEIGSVVVRVGLSLRPRSITVRGGKISIAGSVDDVIEQMRAVVQPRGSDKREPEDPRTAGANGPELHIEGIGLVWTGLLDRASSFEIEGARAERTNTGIGSAQGFISASSVRMGRGAAAAKARGLVARFTRGGTQTTWTEARIEAVDLELPIGAAAASVAGGAATVPSSDSVSRGYVEKARKLRERLTELASWTASHVDPAAPVQVKGFGVVITQGDQRLNIGPGSLDVAHRPDALELDFAPGHSDSKGKTDPSGISLHARIPTGPGEIALHVEGGPVTLAALGVHEQDFGLFDVGRAKLEAKGNLRLSADAERVWFDGDGHLSSLSLVHRALADDPVRGLELAWRASGMAELDGSIFRVDEGKIELGAIRLEAFGAIENRKDFVRIDGRANVPISDCQRMFDSLPQALIPKLEGMKMAGTFSLHSGFSLDTRHPDDMKIDWDLKNHCRITKAPPEIDVLRFSHPFRRTVYDEHNEKVEVVSGPGTPDWVPLRAISPFMELAVTTTEDGGFRNHGGFDKTAIKNSIRDNLRAGKFLRGASTISMQLAKNLYLEREKNLSRKLQEAVLTTYLEQALTKDEILELYFNVVEFGPMIYGIGPAAAHYFDTSASDLSLGQALFLTSILPSPKKTYFSASGQMSKGWLGYLHRLMKIMRDRNKINDAELLDGVSEVMTYRVAKSPRVRPSSDMQKELGTDMPWLAPEGP